MTAHLAGQHLRRTFVGVQYRHAEVGEILGVTTDDGKATNASGRRKARIVLMLLAHRQCLAPSAGHSTIDWENAPCKSIENGGRPIGDILRHFGLFASHIKRDLLS
jgi:hypothetical protein